MRKRIRKCAQLTNCNLPEDIMLDILMRLPFESILTLMCVSKQWKHVIDDSNLLNRHYVHKTVTFPTTEAFYRVFLPSNTTTDCLHPPYMVRRVQPPAVGRKQYLKTKRVYDGMACYYRFGRGGGQFLLHNLSTGTSHAIKNAPMLKCAGDDDDARWPWLCYGFGYDAHDDDYKMTAVCKFNSSMQEFDAQTKDRNVFWVYSFKNSEWVRHIGFPHGLYKLRGESMACSFKGKLHWIVERVGKKRMILTYDLHTCGFGEIATPDVSFFEFPKRDLNLRELGGRLCFSSGYEEIDMWVMNENCWTRLLRMNKWRLLQLNLIGHRIEPVTMYECRDGRKLLLTVLPSDGCLCWVVDRQR